MQFKSLLIASTFGLVIALGAGTPDAMGEEKKEKKNFSIQTGETTVSAGKDGKVNITIVPAKGYKWNKDFPAMLTMKEGTEGVVALKGTQYKGDAFETKDKKVSVAADVTGKKAGAQALQGELRFSVCNEESCIIATEKVEANVTVK